MYHARGACASATVKTKLKLREFLVQVSLSKPNKKSIYFDGNCFLSCSQTSFLLDASNGLKQTVKIMRRYIIALQFLTILPIPSLKRYEPSELGRSAAWFPLVGFSIGAVLLLADTVFSWIFPRALVDALLIALLSLLTGALHLDGLADVFDGIASRGDKEKFLDVMKDSRVGAVGVAGLVMIVLLKYAALLAIPVNLKPELLLLFPSLGRFAQVIVMTGAKAVRNDGLGASFLSGMTTVQLLIAACCIIPLSWFLGNIAGLVALCMVSLWALSVKFYFTRRLSGINGDIVGFSSETAELIALLCLTATITIITRYT